MRFLFVKPRLGWPRTYGHDVHSFEMMRALASLGHVVALATDEAVTEQAVAGLTLDERWVLAGNSALPAVHLGYLQERYRRYWGVPAARISELRHLAGAWKADAVVVVGLESLPYVAAPLGPQRVWYAADEWVWHYLSQIRSTPRQIREYARQAVIKGLYERAYAPTIDRIWVVSETERRAMQLVTGSSHVHVVPNGVDTSAFCPVPAVVVPRSAVFWGRLGFGPNLQALRWFLEKVWPRVRSLEPQASFTILGADPPMEVSTWGGREGIGLVANLPDLRPEIARHQVVVLPFVSGGGIKNKLLEAAAMGKPIVATSRATAGFRHRPPVSVVDDPTEFAATLVAAWNAPDACIAQGNAAREWVARHHTWEAAAEAAVNSFANA
jgi:glycosyltransferase involved in cell wall biosynthesis